MGQIVHSSAIVPLRITADSMSTRQVICCWCYIIIVSVLVCLFIFSVPNAFIVKQNISTEVGTSLADCTHPYLNEDDLIVCESNQTRNNQLIFLLLSSGIVYQSTLVCQFHLADPTKVTTDIDIHTNITIHRVVVIANDTQTYFRATKPIWFEQEIMQLKPTKENRLDSNFKLLTDGHGNVIGHSQSIAYLKNNMQQKALVIFSFTPYPLSNIASITSYAQVNTFPPTSVIFFRCMLFVTSLIFGFYYFSRINLLPKCYLQPQQRILNSISITTILLSNPLYVMSILIPNTACSIITFAFTALALFLLVFWWFYIMDRIAREYSTKVVIFNCWNTICAVLLSIAFFLCVISYALYQLDRRPIYTPSSLLDRFSVCFNVTIVVFILAVIGIVYRVIQVVRSWQTLIHRNKSVFLFQLVSICLLLSLSACTNWIVFDHSDRPVLLFITFMNIHTFYLQYMYCSLPQTISQVLIRVAYSRRDSLIMSRKQFSTIIYAGVTVNIESQVKMVKQHDNTTQVLSPNGTLGEDYFLCEH